MRVQVDVATQLCDELIGAGFGPFFGTPCGILSRLYGALEERGDLLTISREDNAIGTAAGAALAGRYPVVLMQNSGLGQSVNAIASLVTPYRIGMLLVVGMRGTDVDPTQENVVMGRLSGPLLAGLDVETITVDGDPAARVREATELVQREGRAAALLVPPSAFGWQA